MKRKSNLQKLHDDGVMYLTEYVEKLDIRQRQILFMNCIKIIDKTYFDSVFSTNKQTVQFCVDILHFAYPVLVEYLYTDKFEELTGTALCRLTEESLQECRTFLSACKLVGWSAFFLELEKLNVISVSDFFNRSKIKFAQKQRHIEFIESIYVDYYEKIVCSQLEQDSRYTRIVANREDVIERMKTQCFVWLDHYIGYNGDQVVEDYFNDLAYIDSIHNTEWDMYPENVPFRNVTYGSLVGNIVDFAGYAIKHFYYTQILKSQHPELLTENLFYLIKPKSNLLNLIAENHNITDSQAETIIECLSLSCHNVELYRNTQASCAPLIKISKDQYIHSCAGSLYHPFLFLLDNISFLFPKECSANRNNREEVFRKQLYDMFSDKFLCINHPVKIKKQNKEITDIDAVIVDKTTGEIAFFQLKWQDHINLSPKTLLSKSKNYKEKATKWVHDIRGWIEDSTEKEIADRLGLKPKYIDKNNIYLFVLGRRHGNYTGFIPDNANCAWVQWYHLLNYILRTSPSNISISKMHNDLILESPYNIETPNKPITYRYGKYRFTI